MNKQMKDQVKGLMAGLVSKARMPQGKEPIGWLYGHVAKEGETPTHTIDGVGYVGAVLPKLPVVEGYPYEFIALIHSTQKYLLTASTKPGYIFGKQSLFNGMCATEGYFNQYTYDADTDSWVLTREDDGKYGFELQNEKRTLVWCNENVVIEDSTEIYFEKSDPVPVYE